MQATNRRKFIRQVAAVTGGVVLAPIAISCGGRAKTRGEVGGSDSSEIPLSIPSGWDPIAFNRDRGNEGAIPNSYLDDINGPEGRNKHLGKHLPFIPEVESAKIPAGFIPLMWGDAAKGFARHPNAPQAADQYAMGHWYNWVNVRKATDGEAEEMLSEFSNWPSTAEGDTGQFLAAGDQEITEDSGKNTIYLVALPKDVEKGDWIRIHGHCLYHGEYVDFIQVS